MQPAGLELKINNGYKMIVPPLTEPEKELG